MTSTRIAEARDRLRLAEMRHALWPDGSIEEHAQELEPILAGAWPGVYPFAIFVAETEENGIVGFAEVTLRSYADGCDPSRPVGYLEGWYVAAASRRRGIGTALLRAAEEWARDQGCTEMASDTWIDSEVSQQAHESSGFEVVDRVVTYRKTLA
jgi:aminoglycoside 6'-N-acetyltransferase I